MSVCVLSAAPREVMMRTWNRVLVTSGLLTIGMIGCAVEGLSDEEQEDALSRLAC